MADTPPLNFGMEPDSSDLVSESDLLAEARELVMDGNRDEAYKMVTKVLKINVNNLEAIWMYANLAPSPDKAIPALKKLLYIQPDHTKAKALLEKLEAAQNDIFDTPRPTSAAQPAADANQQLMQQMLLQQQKLLEQQMKQGAPVINITNTSTATQGLGGMLSKAGRNDTAYIIGLLVGIFLGTFGLGHLLNGKIGTGIVLMLVGWFIWIPIAVGVSTLTVGIGACLMIPLHIVIAHNTANSGAQYT